MRQLTDHKVTTASEELTVTVMDEPGNGGANHHYSIRWKNDKDQTEPHCFIGFQDGPVKEHGVNGITEQALLAIVIDRYRSFQAGPYACRENAVALTKMEEALMWMHKRTRDRIARGVEGTKQK